MSVISERKIQVRQTADDDLLDIFIYGCEKFGVDAAEAYILRLEAGFQHLLQHPQLGRSIGQTIEGIRALSVVSHIICYSATDTTVDIIRILHKSMLAERHLGNTDA